MPIAEKSIISPEEIKPGIPIKKGTLGVLALLIAGGTFLTSVLMQGGTTNATQQPSATTAKLQSTDAGTAAAIDEERKKVEEDLNRKKREIEAARIAAGPKGSPVPDSVRRDNQDGALLEKAMIKVGANGTPAKGTQVSGNGRADENVELDAQSRLSKVLAMDYDGQAGGSSAKDDMLKALGGMGSLGATQVQGGVKAPSESVPSGIESALGALRAQGASARPGTDRAWLNEYADDRTAKRNEVIKSYPTVSKYTLHQGKVISAVLGRKINSDLPGDITAHTTLDVYDSLGKGQLLIPKGSTLVGRYDSQIKMGQERVMFAFQRIVMPDGQSFDLPAAQGSDLAGTAGMTGDVNNHFIKMFASSFLVAWSADRVQQNGATSNGTTTTSPAGQVLVDVGRTILERNKAIPPTITIDQGTRINVEVARDMEFNGPYARSRN